jgi:hypothetical protein
MHFRRVDRWIDEHIATVGSALITLVIILYTISQFVPDVGQWIITRGFFNVLLIVLMVDLLRRVIDLKGSPASTEVFENQQQALPDVQKFIERKRPETCDLIEYSTSSIRTTLLEDLRRANVRIRLLACQPDNAVTDHERKAIELGIANIQRDFKDYNRIKVKLYATPASLRGRNLGGKSINVGWYLYSHDDGEIRVSGHNNPMIASDAETPQGQKLKQMFTQAFETLWNDPATEELPLAQETQYSIGQTSHIPKLRHRRTS